MNELKQLKEQFNTEIYSYNEIKAYMYDFITDMDFRKIEIPQAHAIMLAIAERFFIPCDYWKSGNLDPYYIYNINLIFSEYYINRIFKRLIYNIGIIPSISLYISFLGNISKDTVYNWLYSLNPSRTKYARMLQAERRELAIDKTINSNQIVGTLHFLNTNTETELQKEQKVLELSDLRKDTIALVGSNKSD